jgi:uncharacterized protein
MKVLHRLRQYALLCWLCCLTIVSAELMAAPEFPKLSGRVVDNAGFLSAGVKKQISEQLAAHEKASANQVVVVTLPDLQGYSIEEYGYQLGREWGIGQKGEDNGVLLIVAKAERKVRIEVGYGLEGTLTDAISANIIHGVITPAFKKGQFEAGIQAGVTAVVEALGGQYVMKERQTKGKDTGRMFFFFIFFVLMFWPLLTMFLPHSMTRGRGYHGGYGGFGGGGFGGGGFSGGGGSFGGGGASGGW